MVLITFVGDFKSAHATLGGKGRIMAVIDQTSKQTVRVQVPQGTLTEFADMCKTGQVLHITGFGETAGGYGLLVRVPLVIRAQSGTNEADLNRLAMRWGEELSAAVVNPVDPAMFKSVQEDLRMARSAAAVAVADGVALRAKLEEMDKVLQYERLLNGALKED